MVFRLPALVMLAALLAGCTGEPPAAPRPSDQQVPRVALAGVLAGVRRAPAIRTLPSDLTPPVATAGEDTGFDHDRCEAAPAADRVAEPCVFGDRAGAVRVVLFGDSHAGMWLPAMTPIAERHHWRLELYGKPACPAPRLTFWNEQESRAFVECDRFRDFAIGQIQATRPALVVVTGESFGRKLDRGVPVTAAQWREGLEKTLATLRRSASRVLVIGGTPVLAESAPECLAAHRTNLPACFTTRAKATERVYNRAEAAAARATGSGYISVLPWLCGAVCTPVIGSMTVYRNRFQLSATYARMLNGVLENAVLATAPPDRMP